MKKNDFKDELIRTNDWVKFVDQKAFGLLAFQTIFLGYFITQTKVIVDIFVNKITIPRGILAFLLLVLFIVLVISFVFSFKTFFPGLKNNKKSLIYFGDISSMSFKNYQKEIMNLTDTQYHNEIISQIFTNSEICNNKYKNFSFAAKTFIFCIPVGIGSMILINLIEKLKT